MAPDISKLFAVVVLMAEGTAEGGMQRTCDRELLAAFASGDRDAFTRLYQQYAKSVFQFAFYMTGDTEQANELTQQVFVWLVQHPAAYDAERGSLPAFLGGVARKFLRRQQRMERRWFPLDDAIEMLHSLSGAQGTAHSLEAAVDAGIVRRTIALLPMRYREVVVICDLQEKEYAAAAEMLGCSVGTVRSRLHRGRALLARKLRACGGFSSAAKGEGDGL